MSGPLPGYSVPELIKTAVALYRVYEAFRHEYRNAPKQIAGFRDELNRVDEALKAQHQINQWIGRDYAGTESFQDAVAECANFLHTHKRLLDRNEGKQSFSGVLQTVAAAFDKDLPRLQQKLSHNRIELIGHNVTLLLQRSLSGTDRVVAASPTAQQPSPGSSLAPDKAKLVEQVLRQLFGVGYNYKRLNNGVLQAPEPGLVRPEDLDDRFQNCISSLCTLLDLPAHHLAQLPIDDVAGQLFKDRWQTIVESSSRVSRYTDDSTFEPLVSRTCQVDIELGRQRITVSSYILFMRCCYWRDQQNQPILEHKLPLSPRKCFPYSSHKILNKPLLVGFLEDQDLVVKSTLDRPMRGRPQYHFTLEREYLQFQSDLRAKDLVHEFHVASIASKNARGGADAHNEVVKIWAYGAGDVQASATFPARLRSQTQHFEPRLRWFHAPEIQGRVVRLTLAQAPSAKSRKSSQSQDHDGDNSSFLSKLSPGRRSSASSVSSSAASITSVNTIMAQSEYAPRDWVELIGYLNVKFTSAAEAGEFVQAWQQVMTRPSPAPTAYSMTTASTAPSSVFSSSPNSLHSISRRPVPNRSSTAATSPVSPTTIDTPSARTRTDSSSCPPVEELYLPLSAQAAEDDQVDGRRRTVDRGTDPYSSPAIVAHAETPSSLLRDARNDSW